MALERPQAGRCSRPLRGGGFCGRRLERAVRCGARHRDDVPASGGAGGNLVEETPALTGPADVVDLELELRRNPRGTVGFVPHFEVVARRAGEQIGRMSWTAKLITYVEVAPEHRRRGVATAIYRFALAEAEADPTVAMPLHSHQMTPEGRAWSGAVGGERSALAKYLDTHPRLAG